MGSVVCYCELNNSKVDRPARPIRFNPKFQAKAKPNTLPTSTGIKYAFVEEVGRCSSTAEIKSQGLISINELNCDFGITESDEVESEEKGNKVQVDPKLIPNNLNSFLQSIQRKISCGESCDSSNNFLEEKETNSSPDSLPIGVPIKCHHQHTTPELKRSFPVLLSTDMSTVGVGRSKKILYKKLREMGLIKPKLKLKRSNSCSCL
ncbi:unnamed protein product [Moneuplotes crassus]|uniref:Uncharacterized protein n=1 Tax=Euplotes crassus TaxID=5936 RepID=A0AAD1UKW2_EUPCR|nr:unnamed protein product [Moneuplotes crassus]